MKNFEHGMLVVTRGVGAKMEEEDCKFAHWVMASIQRHYNCDWGDLCEDDKQENEYALANGGARLFSCYKDFLGKIYIITEADRSVTTVLFPEEY